MSDYTELAKKAQAWFVGREFQKTHALLTELADALLEVQRDRDKFRGWDMANVGDLVALSDQIAALKAQNAELVAALRVLVPFAIGANISRHNQNHNDNYNICAQPSCSYGKDQIAPAEALLKKLETPRE